MGLSPAIAGPRWAVSALTGFNLNASGLHREAGVEVARVLLPRTEAFAQGMRSDDGELRGDVGLRVRF